MRFTSNHKLVFTCGSINTTIEHRNTQVKYTMHTSHTLIHISHNMSPLEANKQISPHSYTNSEGHITANEYSVEQGEAIKRSLIQALETYWVVRHRNSHIVWIIDLFLAVRLLTGRALLPRIILRNIFWYSFMLEAEQTSGSWCGWKAHVQCIILSYLTGSRTRGLLACSIAPQSSILLLIQSISTNSNINWYDTLNSNTNEVRIVRNCCNCTSPWPSIHSTSLQLHSLHFNTTISPSLTNFASRDITALHFTSLHVT
jgi:hypothetical protein